ncbi:MAG: hypothetical protein IJS01_13915 [Lentisphaeria bacterium]|nr:hypothetical protein [Lentisphaeria bacterium]
MAFAAVFFAVVAAGCVFFGSRAGRAEGRKRLLLWFSGAFVWSAAAGIALFCMKGTLREIVFRISPKTRDLALILTALNFSEILDKLGLHFGIMLFLAASVVFMLGFTAFRNEKKRYRPLLWTAGELLLFGILFPVLFCGFSAWMNLFGSREQEIFDPASTHLPSFYAVLLMYAAASAVWGGITLKRARNSRKSILIFSGAVGAVSCLLWLSAFAAGARAEKAVDDKAAQLGISPLRVTAGDPPGPGDREKTEEWKFFKEHPKYQPPFSGRYNWSADAGADRIPDDVRAETLRLFDSPEMREHLDAVKRVVSLSLSRKRELYLGALQSYRSLMREIAERAVLFAVTGQKEKIMPELMKGVALENLMAPDTPFLIGEHVRAAARLILMTAYLHAAPDDPSALPYCRKMLAWCKSWQVRLPSEAGMALPPPEKPKTAVGFLYRPCLLTARYRLFFTAIERIPALRELERQEVFAGKGVFIGAARKQRTTLVLGRTAAALKLYRAEHGRYPARLADLVPRYLEKEYLSPETGKKLAYALKDGHFTLSAGNRYSTLQSRLPIAVP